MVSFWKCALVPGRQKFILQIEEICLESKGRRCVQKRYARRWEDGCRTRPSPARKEMARLGLPRPGSENCGRQRLGHQARCHVSLPGRTDRPDALYDG